MSFVNSTKSLGSIIVCTILIVWVSSFTYSAKSTAQASNLTTFSSLNQTKGFSGLPFFQNYTGSIEVFPTVIQALKSQMQTSLNDAVTNAIKSIGPNSSALSASIQENMGFLIYRIFVLDADNSIHIILVDAGNGKVLSKQGIPSWAMSNRMMLFPPFDAMNTPPASIIGP
jgi:hypothetical protein